MPEQSKFIFKLWTPPSSWRLDNDDWFKSNISKKKYGFFHIMHFFLLLALCNFVQHLPTAFCSLLSQLSNWPKSNHLIKNMNAQGVLDSFSRINKNLQYHRQILFGDVLTIFPRHVMREKGERVCILCDGKKRKDSNGHNWFFNGLKSGIKGRNSCFALS